MEAPPSRTNQLDEQSMTSGALPDTSVGQEPWWGRIDVEEGKLFSRRVGALVVHVCRKSNEWQVGHERLSDEELTHPETASVLETASMLADDLNLERYVFARTHPPLQLTPALADRSVVSRPVKLLHVPAGEESVIYVSSPLWVKIEVEDPPTLLQELAIVRPSDTWFGATTREGELCYASRTSARLDLTNVPVRPDRAVTLVRVRNHSNETLHLERLSLPVPHLSLFAVNDLWLWTQDVMMTRSPGGETAEIAIGTGAPGVSQDAVRVCEPRLALERRTLVKTWTMLFG